MADNTPQLGKLVNGHARRDAVHVAVAPVVAGHRLQPRQDVGLIDGRACANANWIGIVDPFLKHPVEEGQVFWLCLYPNTVTSLRHVWTHPAFTPKVPQ